MSEEKELTNRETEALKALINFTENERTDPKDGKWTIESIIGRDGYNYIKDIISERIKITSLGKTIKKELNRLYKQEDSNQRKAKYIKGLILSLQRLKNQVLNEYGERIKENKQDPFYKPAAALYEIENQIDRCNKELKRYSLFESIDTKPTPQNPKPIIILNRKAMINEYKKFIDIPGFKDHFKTVDDWLNQFTGQKIDHVFKMIDYFSEAKARAFFIFWIEKRWIELETEKDMKCEYLILTGNSTKIIQKRFRIRKYSEAGNFLSQTKREKRTTEITVEKLSKNPKDYRKHLKH